MAVTEVRPRKQVRRRRRLPRALVAIAIGLTAVVATALLSVAAVLVWPTVSGTNEPLDASSQLALAQVVTGLLSIGLTVGLGYFAFTEFMQRQQEPDLALCFRGDDEVEHEVMVLPLHGRAPAEKDHIVQLTIRNSGDAPATSYMLRIWLPFLPLDEEKALALSQPVVGHGDWTIFSYLRRDSETKVTGLSFRGHGSAAAFPGIPIVLCVFRIPIAHFREPRRYECEYTVVADRGQERPGVLVLDVVPFMGKSVS